nr:hypothetical protein [Micromonospora sp. DSM 115978]
IRTTFTASPRRARTLAAKAVVVGTVAFVVGLVASVVGVQIVVGLEGDKGWYFFPTTTWTELRVVIGTAALLAAAAVMAVAVGAALRRGAGAATTVIVLIVVPYVLAVSSVLPSGVGQWLLRITPAAGFAVQQSVPAYSQVDALYTPALGFFPLPPWGGFAVTCGYAAVALGLAVVLVRRRDA